MCLVSPRFLGLTCTADVLSTCLAAPLPLQGFTFWGFCALGGGGGGFSWAEGLNSYSVRVSSGC